MDNDCEEVERHGTFTQLKLTTNIQLELDLGFSHLAILHSSILLSKSLILSPLSISHHPPVDVGAYVEKEVLSIGNKNEKIMKSKGMQLQPCNSMSEAQQVTIYSVTSVRLSISIITKLLFCQFDEGLQAIYLIWCQHAYRK